MGREGHMPLLDGRLFLDSLSRQVSPAFVEAFWENETFPAVSCILLAALF